MLRSLQCLKSKLKTRRKNRKKSFMIWYLLLLAAYFVARKIMWLRVLGAIIKKQRRMRVEQVECDASTLPGLHDSVLHPLTRALQELGFVVAGDLMSRLDYEPETTLVAPPIPDPGAPQFSSTVKNSVEVESHGFARVFVHPDYGCYATLVSVITVSHFPAEMRRADKMKVEPFRTAITTSSGTQDDSWSFATHNREVKPFSLLQRHPRRLSTRLVGATAQQLLESHLAQRDEIATLGGFIWDKAPSLSKYREFEARSLRHIRSVYEGASLLRVASHLQTYRLAKNDRWMGELTTRRRTL